MKFLEYKNPYWADNHENFNELLTLVKERPKSYCISLKATGRKREKTTPQFRHIYEWIMRLTQKYDEYIPNLLTRVYWVLNGLESPIVCSRPGCENFLSKSTFNYNKSKQPQYCSRFCLRHSPLTASRISKSMKSYDSTFWKDAEQKKRLTKILKGKDPTWNNQEKARKTIQKILLEDSDYYARKVLKTKAAKVRNGHDENWNNPKKAIKTRYRKNNGVWETDKSKQRRKTTNLKKYGFESHNSSPVVKQHKELVFERKFGKGITHYWKSESSKQHMKEINEQRKRKEYASKKRNHSFNSSQEEKTVEILLIERYGRENVMSQYRCERYPFLCDFYIHSEDLFIECNFSWTHGGHQFDPQSIEDLEKLGKWISRGTKYYWNAIVTWIFRDWKKQQIAKRNKLNYIVFWDIAEAKSFVSQSK